MPGNSNGVLRPFLRPLCLIFGGIGVVQGCSYLFAAGRKPDVSCADRGSAECPYTRANALP
jgi:hypothetical protein